MQSQKFAVGIEYQKKGKLGRTAGAGIGLSNFISLRLHKVLEYDAIGDADGYGLS